MSMQPGQPGWMVDFPKYVRSLTVGKWYDLPYVTELRKVLQMREEALQETRSDRRSAAKLHGEALNRWQGERTALERTIEKRESTIARLTSSVEGLKIRNESLIRDCERYRSIVQEKADRPTGMDRHLVQENAELKRRIETIRHNRDELADMLKAAEIELDKLRNNG